MPSIWLAKLANRWRKSTDITRTTGVKHKFKAGDVVIFVNDFGVVWRWTISERTTYELCTGEIVPAYHHEGTQTPWLPTEESRLRKATKADLTASDAELQARYGFTPTEWYGCF